jgi:hypothetical protein
MASKFSARSAAAFAEWQATRGSLGEIEPDCEIGSELEEDDIEMLNFEVTAEPGVFDEEHGVISHGGYYKTDAEGNVIGFAEATGAPAVMADGTLPKWLYYDLLYIKSKGTEVEQGIQRKIGFTHDQFPPQLKEDREGEFWPEDYCTVVPIPAKPLDIIFWMDDLGKAKNGYCHGKVYVGVRGEWNEELEELEHDVKDIIEGKSGETNIKIASVSFEGEGGGTDELAKKLESYYDSPKRGWKLTGSCAIRMYSDAAKSNSSLVAEADGMMLPVGIYPVKLGFSDNGKDKAWLPKIDARNSSLNLANLFVKGWTNKKLTVKVRNTSNTSTVEDGFTGSRIKPCYEIPAYHVKGETISVPIMEEVEELMPPKDAVWAKEKYKEANECKIRADAFRMQAAQLRLERAGNVE